MAVSRTEPELAALAAETGVEYLVESVATAEGCARIIDETSGAAGADRDPHQQRRRALRRTRSRSTRRSPPVWHEVFATNLHGPFELIRRAARDMIAARRGRIVIVSSSAGEFGVAGMPAYCASRNGLLGLMRAVAQDVGRLRRDLQRGTPGLDEDARWRTTSCARRPRPGHQLRAGMGRGGGRIPSPAAGRSARDRRHDRLPGVRFGQRDQRRSGHDRAGRRLVTSVDYWIRRRPFFDATRRAGCDRYSFANHMYQPAATAATRWRRTGSWSTTSRCGTSPPSARSRSPARTRSRSPTC